MDAKAFQTQYGGNQAFDKLTFRGTNTELRIWEI